MPQNPRKSLRLANGPAAMVVTQVSHLMDLSRQFIQTLDAKAAQEAAEKLILPDQVSLQKVRPRVVLLIERDV